MAEGNELARQLLEIAAKTYRAEILSEISGPKRYTGAMIGNAVDIAERALERADPATALLVEVFGDEADQMANDLSGLAKAIRSGEISDSTHDGLRRALNDYVTAKLEISNPRFLRRCGS